MPLASAVMLPTPAPSPTPDTISTAEAVAAELHALGVEHFFLMTGRDNKLWIALEKVGIRQVLARSEAGAVYMADAYARVRGRRPSSTAPTDPGAANVAGALAEPYWSGQPGRGPELGDAAHRALPKEYQELDQPPLFAVGDQVGRRGVPAGAHAATRPRGGTSSGEPDARSGVPGHPGDIFEDEMPGLPLPPA